MSVSFDTSMDEGYRMSMGVDTMGVPPRIGLPASMASTAVEVTRGFAYLGDAEAGYDQIVRTIETATAAVLGRVNADEFLSWWPSVIGTGKVDRKMRRMPSG